MFKLGDKVIHLKSRCVGKVVLVSTRLDDFALEIDYKKESDHHSDTASYTIDGKVWLEDEEPAIVPATKLHKLLYGIED